MPASTVVHRVIATLLTVAALAFSAPAHAATPKGIVYGPVVATVPQQESWNTTLDAVHADASGGLAVAAYQRVVTFDAAGHLQGEWTPPGSPLPYDRALVAVAPDGTVYAAMTRTNTIGVYGRDGTLRESLGGAGVLHSIARLAYDPRGSLLVADVENSDTAPFAVLRRLGLAGGLLATFPYETVGLPLTVAEDGTRWAVGGSGISVRSPDGRIPLSIGRDCGFSHVNPFTCARDTGSLQFVSALAVDRRGRLAVANPVVPNLQLYGPQGRLRFTCGPPDPLRGVSALGVDPSRGGLLVGDGLTVRRASYTTKPVNSCWRSSMRIDHVTKRRVSGRVNTWQISYRLSKPSRAFLDITRVVSSPCPASAADSFDPHGSCEQLFSYIARPRYRYSGEAVPGHQGANSVRVRLPRGRFSLQLRAVSRQSEGAEAPWLYVADAADSSRAR